MALSFMRRTVSYFPNRNLRIFNFEGRNLRVLGSDDNLYLCISEAQPVCALLNRYFARQSDPKLSISRCKVLINLEWIQLHREIWT